MVYRGMVGKWGGGGGWGVVVHDFLKAQCF